MSYNYNRRPHTSGFSLVELMIVISIIAIMTGVIGFVASDMRQQGRDAQRQSDLQLMKASIETYRQKNERYPEMGCIPSGGWSRQQDCLNFIDGLTDLIGQLPRDPFLGSGEGYMYRTNTDGTVYKLMSRGSVEKTVTNDHPLQACDRTLCGTGCTSLPVYSSSYAVWGGFASDDLDDTRGVICQM